MNLENKPNSGSFDHFCQLPIEKIVPSRLQPRKYFSGEGMEQLVASVRQCGILEPLIVRSLSEDRFELVAGERRYRAAELAGLDTVPAMVREMDDAEALECALTENILRENLNPIEETEGILHLLELKLNVDQKSVISILNRRAKQKRGRADAGVRPEDWDAIASVFESLGKGTPESFRTHCLPLLNLPPDILDAVRQQKIKAKVARAIVKIEDVELRAEILKDAIDYSLSLSQIQERIKGEKPVIERDELQTRMEAVPKKIKKMKAWDDPEKRSKLESLLADIEQVLSE